LRTERIGASWKAYIILYRWDDIIKIGFIVMVMDGIRWIQLSDDGLVVGCCEHGNEHSNSMKCKESLAS
jgi:hypothetical protein